MSEITQVTFRFLYLLKPGQRLNALIVGALARAQELYPIRLHAFVFTSSHFHLQATVDDAEQMARFMGHFTGRLSREVCLVHDWDTTVFPRRYHHVEISPEPEMELARLRYILSHGCKEGLVESPRDWPGVSSTEALITGRPMRGVWVNRTAYGRARDRGERVTEREFEEVKELRLEPLPSLAHLSPESYRKVMLGLVMDIEQETRARHKVDGTRPLGVLRILACDPHGRTNEPPRSPRPWFHALSREVREAMRTALVMLFVAYREASERFRGGEYGVEFPPGSFPPARPFVSPGPPEPG